MGLTSTRRERKLSRATGNEGWTTCLRLQQPNRDCLIICRFSFDGDALLVKEMHTAGENKYPTPELNHQHFSRSSRHDHFHPGSSQVPAQMKLLPTAKTEQLGDSVNNKQLSPLNTYGFSYHSRVIRSMCVAQGFIIACMKYCHHNVRKTFGHAESHNCPV